MWFLKKIYFKKPVGGSVQWPPSREDEDSQPSSTYINPSNNHQIGSNINSQSQQVSQQQQQQSQQNYQQSSQQSFQKQTTQQQQSIQTTQQQTTTTKPVSILKNTQQNSSSINADSSSSKYSQQNQTENNTFAAGPGQTVSAPKRGRGELCQQQPGMRTPICGACDGHIRWKI